MSEMLLPAYRPEVASPPVRWGILSTAKITGRWIPALAAAQGAELVAVASRDPLKARRAAEEWGCRAVESYDALIEDDAVEAVYIPLPNGLHAEWASRCLRAGKMVVCEKSLVATREQLDQLQAAVAETGGWLEESFQYRHHPLFDWAREKIAGGAIGRPVRGVGHFFIDLQDATNIRWDRALGGGAQLDLGCYTLGVQRHMLGEEPVSVSAEVEWQESPTGLVDATLDGKIVFSSGAAGVTRISYKKAFVCHWGIIGEEGAIHCPHDFAWSPKEHGRQMLRWTRFDRAGASGERGGAGTVVTAAEVTDPYRNMVEECSARWRAGLPPRWGVADAGRNLAALWAMLESGRQGGRSIEVQSEA